MAQIANPASVNCVKRGGSVLIRKQADGSEYGLCIFRDGSHCEEWALFREECKPGAGAGQASYDDPFAYCAALGTIDVPDHRYNGGAIPDSLVRGMVGQGIVSADAPQEFKEKAAWRCLDGDVLVCHFGANLTCLAKADISRAPTASVQDFCRANPGAENVPAVVAGRATVYEWKCVGGKPAISRQLFHIDPQGYVAEFWFRLTPEQPEPNR